ncbi:unnamed protein product, partial [Discosporangium mesarthrocarpum]
MEKGAGDWMGDSLYSGKTNSNPDISNASVASSADSADVAAGRGARSHLRGIAPSHDLVPPYTGSRPPHPTDLVWQSMASSGTNDVHFFRSQGRAASAPPAEPTFPYNGHGGPRLTDRRHSTVSAPAAHANYQPGGREEFMRASMGLPPSIPSWPVTSGVPQRASPSIPDDSAGGVGYPAKAGAKHKRGREGGEGAWPEAGEIGGRGQNFLAG